MKIDNLTQEQVDMLDKLWTLDTEDECMSWLLTLSIEKQAMALALMEMMTLSHIDDLVEQQVDYPEARAAFAQIGVAI